MEIFDRIGLSDIGCENIWNKWVEWHHQDGCEFDEIWYGYDVLCEKTLIIVKDLKKFMKIMRDKKIGYHSPCINYEYQPAGSGNFIYDKYVDKSWEQIKELIND